MRKFTNFGKSMVGVLAVVAAMGMLTACGGNNDGANASTTPSVEAETLTSEAATVESSTEESTVASTEETTTEADATEDTSATDTAAATEDTEDASAATETLTEAK